MLTIGDKFPKFCLTAVKEGKLPDSVSESFFQINEDYFAKKWLVAFFWPKNFTFVCPTEMAGFSKLAKDFAERGAKLIGISTDNEFSHLAWKKDGGMLQDLAFPMVSDVKHELSHALGVINIVAGVPNRATFIVDPEGVIRHVSVNDLSVGRNPDEVLRTLDALKTGELCGCSWKKGEKSIKV
jgi:alkyl hydroperoxide reductase subunit AhpC